LFKQVLYDALSSPNITDEGIKCRVILGGLSTGSPTKILASVAYTRWLAQIENEQRAVIYPRHL
jgi:hypothetical protein